MTQNDKELIGKIINHLITFAIDAGVAYLLGHQFHSYAIGWSAYLVFSSLSAIYIRLTQIKENN